ncbi:hypothetical protein BH11PAT2_BH11PAT2_08710 [soil metagenome]
MSALIIETDDNTGKVRMDLETVARRFNNFFKFPWAGREWETMEPEAIYDFFMAVMRELVQRQQENRDAAIAEFASQNAFLRAWLKFRGWKAPKAYTIHDMIDETYDRCRQFSTWAADAQHRPFYADSDMSTFIRKPLRVAELLCPPQFAAA